VYGNKKRTYAGTSHSETATGEYFELFREKSGKRICFSAIIKLLAELDNGRMCEIAGAPLINSN
jgi:hypothetical protein